MGSKLAKIRSSAEGTSSAFMTVYTAPPGFSFPKDFDLGAYGLLLAESFSHDGDGSVALYWASAERAAAQEARVLALLPLARRACPGSVIEILSPKRVTWTDQPAKISRVFLSVAALFGALSVVRDYFADFFYAPDVVVFAPAVGPMNLHVGDPLEVRLQVLNEARLGAADVAIRSAELTVSTSPGDPQPAPHPLVLSVQRFPHLLAGQHADLDVSGTLLGAAHGMRDPVHCYLTIKAHAKGGLFVPGHDLRVDPLAISLWQDRSWETNWSRSSEKIATLTIRIYPGVKYPEGLIGRLVFRSVLQPETHGILAAPGNSVEPSQPVWDPGQGSYLTEVDLHTKPFEPFKEYSLRISVPFVQRLDDSGWETLRSSTRVELK